MTDLRSRARSNYSANINCYLANIILLEYKPTTTIFHWFNSWHRFYGRINLLSRDPARDGGSRIQCFLKCQYRIPAGRRYLEHCRRTNHFYSSAFFFFASFGLSANKLCESWPRSRDHSVVTPRGKLRLLKFHRISSRQVSREISPNICRMHGTYIICSKI